MQTIKRRDGNKTTKNVNYVLFHVSVTTVSLYTYIFFHYLFTVTGSVSNKSSMWWKLCSYVIQLQRLTASKKHINSLDHGSWLLCSVTDQHNQKISAITNRAVICVKTCPTRLLLGSDLEHIALVYLLSAPADYTQFDCCIDVFALLSNFN